MGPSAAEGSNIWHHQRASAPCLPLQEVIASGTSAEGIPDAVVQPLGIHSADPARNYAFHNWNHVYVYYCTSDSSLGTRVRSSCCE